MSAWLMIFTKVSPQQYKGLDKKKQDLQNQISRKNKTLFSGILNTNISNPTKYIGASVEALSNGWRAGLIFGRLDKKNYNPFLRISLNEFKNPKEEKFTSSIPKIQGLSKPRPYIYGKINSFYSLNINYGKEKILFRNFLTPYCNILICFDAGFSLGLLKPYHLLINVSDTLNQYNIISAKYDSANEKYFLERTKIYGGSPISKGIKEIKLIPGVNLNSMISVDLNSKSVWQKRIVLGVELNGYKPIVVTMMNNSSKQVITFFWVGLLLGKNIRVNLIRLNRN